MTELDAEIGPLALELVNEYGKAVLYTRVTPGDYNTDTGTVDNVTVELEIRALVEDYNLQSAGQVFASGLIEVGDKKITVAAQSVSELPTTQDTFLIDNIEFRIVNIKVVYSGDLAALYEIQARR